MSEKSLYIALILSAAKDASPITAKSERCLREARKNRKNAIEWFNGADADVTFEECCDGLDLDLESVFNALPRICTNEFTRTLIARLSPTSEAAA